MTPWIVLAADLPAPKQESPEATAIRIEAEIEARRPTPLEFYPIEETWPGWECANDDYRGGYCLRRLVDGYIVRLQDGDTPYGEDTVPIMQAVPAPEVTS